ncbi:MAG: hypothetical protein OEY64_06625 [Nitrospinota bacterium]|nr:hypothetical protein [Nitrospinota bacterium]
MKQLGYVQQVVGLYAMQNIYADRLKAYKMERPVVQIQRDSVVISSQAKILQKADYREKKESRSLTYTNPRIDNPGMGNTLANELTPIPA